MQNGIKPNIFFIMCDELRSDVFGFMGNRTIKTPHLDQFSNDCAIFHNAFTVSPMCSPARTSLATGKYPLSHGVLDNGLMPVEGEQSIYEQLRQYGYRTLNFAQNDPDGNGKNDTYGMVMNQTLDAFSKILRTNWVCCL